MSNILKDILDSIRGLEIETTSVSTDKVMVIRDSRGAGREPIYITLANLITGIGGIAPIPVVRINNPIVALNTVNANIQALDAAVGVSPTSLNIIQTSKSANSNLSLIDATYNNMPFIAASGITTTVGRMTLKTKIISHACTAAATNVMAINVPVGAIILAGQVITDTSLVFAGGGVSANVTWTTSGLIIATALAAKNTEASKMYDSFTRTALVAGTVETMTLTPNAGTIDVGGVVICMAYYYELTDPIKL